MKKYFLAALGVLISATPVLAHHPLGGQPMETFAQGLLSGIGHPLLGFDHLFFVIAIGVAALYTGYARLAPAAYIGAMLVGCLMMSFGIGLPFKEVIIGLSLLTIGYIVLSGRALSITPAIALFAIFGLFHGSAFGDSIAAQEASVGAPVLIGYLIGLGVLQYGIALASGYIVVKIWKATAAQAVEARIAGAVVAGIGAFLTLENLEGILFGALV
ncbi:MAG: HupE/UreJ family protein [Sneathiella sp.]|uniref:HupE/UreJ family protein n=1 Tax=Sneathiella sp. TaxID=1964365 RepID=UPI0030014D3E